VLGGTLLPSGEYERKVSGFGSSPKFSHLVVGSHPTPSKIIKICSFLTEMHCKMSVYALSDNGKESWEKIQGPRKNPDRHKNVTLFSLGYVPPSIKLDCNCWIYFVQKKWLHRWTDEGQKNTPTRTLHSCRKPVDNSLLSFAFKVNLEPCLHLQRSCLNAVCSCAEYDMIDKLCLKHTHLQNAYCVNKRIDNKI